MQGKPDGSHLSYSSLLYAVNHAEMRLMQDSFSPACRVSPHLTYQAPFHPRLPSMRVTRVELIRLGSQTCIQAIPRHGGGNVDECLGLSSCAGFPLHDSGMSLPWLYHASSMSSASASPNVLLFVIWPIPFVLMLSSRPPASPKGRPGFSMMSGNTSLKNSRT